MQSAHRVVQRPGSPPSPLLCPLDSGLLPTGMGSQAGPAQQPVSLQSAMQKAAFEALQVKKDLMHRQIRNQVSGVRRPPSRPVLSAFRDIQRWLDRPQLR